MRKMMKRVGAIIASVVITLSSSIVASAETGYTYNYDFWDDVQYSPDAYSVAGVYTSADLGLDKKLNMPAGMYVNGNMLYICDTNNNRIVELERYDVDQFMIRRIIDTISGDTDKTTLNGPTDIAISENGYIFICDKNNERIIKLDNDLRLITSFVKPQDANFDQNLSFLPHKLIIDRADRVYCIATNVNKGLIKFEPDGEFSGFVGATPVSYTFVDYIKKKLATKAQRDQMESFTPTEYDNIYVDDDGFMYAVTNNLSQEDIRSGAVNPVRKINLKGNDILVRNGNQRIIGDIYFDAGGGVDGPSRFIDVTAFDNEVYTVLDKNRGRLFSYDDQGRMLWCFGGVGNSNGRFKNAIALEHMGYDLFVLDQQNGSITIFTPTEFGKKVYQALDQFQNGDYAGSGASWQEVIDLNGNYDLAYIGIGRTLFRQKRYKEALEYFELKYDRDNYSKAYKQYRKVWVEENIVLIVILLAVIIFVPLIVGRLKRIKFQIDTADIFRE